MDELKALIEEQGKAWKAFREENDKRLQAIEKGQGTAEMDSKLSAINADLDKLGKAIGDMKASMDKQSIGAGMENSKELTELRAWIRSKVNGQFKAAVVTNDDPSGGFASMPEFEKMIDRVAAKNSVMRQLATVTTIGAASFKQLVNKGGVAGAWADEMDTISQTATPNLAQVEIFARKLVAYPMASEESLEDLSFDVAAWLAEEAGITFAELEGGGFISGSGNKQPSGILSVPAVANASYDWGKVGYIASGAAADFAASNPSDQLIDLVHALKAKYRNNASFLLADTTLAKIRKFKDSQNNYLWQPGLAAGVQDTLLGKPVFTDDNMPAVGANALAIAFGDFKAAYRIVDRRGIKVLSDPYTTPGAVKMFTTKRTGGGVKNFEAYKVLKIAAS
jgi:HK97 family phage major capsid protein